MLLRCGFPRSSSCCSLAWFGKFRSLRLWEVLRNELSARKCSFAVLSRTAHECSISRRPHLLRMSSEVVCVKRLMGNCIHDMSMHNMSTHIYLCVFLGSSRPSSLAPARSQHSCRLVFLCHKKPHCYFLISVPHASYLSPHACRKTVTLTTECISQSISAKLSVIWGICMKITWYKTQLWLSATCSQWKQHFCFPWTRLN